MTKEGREDTTPRFVTSLAATQSAAQTLIDPGTSLSFTEASYCESSDQIIGIIKNTANA